LRVHDWPLDQVPCGDRAAYYLLYPEFAEFVRTPGFRTYDGTGLDKPALTTLGLEAGARGCR